MIVVAGMALASSLGSVTVSAQDFEKLRPPKPVAKPAPKPTPRKPAVKASPQVTVNPESAKLLAKAKGFYSDGKYSLATLNYYEIYKSHPRSAEAPEALVGLSESLLALEKLKDACLTRKEVLEVYPGNLTKSLRARLDRVKRDAAC